MSIVIIDTGCANLSSVKYALERLGYQPIISQNPDVILSASKLLLPGVGTAKAAMEQLQQRDLIALIKTSTQPVLGICLGMQLLAKYSDEGNVETLGMIDESIIRIPDHGLPLPHMGWNTVYFENAHPLFKGIESGAYFYFVHGFALPCCDATIAQTSYGVPFTAVLQKDNFFGVQFHPERSGTTGAQLLKNFLEL